MIIAPSTKACIRKAKMFLPLAAVASLVLADGLEHAAPGRAGPPFDGDEDDDQDHDGDGQVDVLVVRRRYQVVQGPRYARQAAGAVTSQPSSSMAMRRKTSATPMVAMAR